MFFAIFSRSIWQIFVEMNIFEQKIYSIYKQISLTTKDIAKISKNIILGPKLKMRLKYFKFQNEA